MAGGFLRLWRQAAEDLGLEIEGPLNISLKNGASVNVDVVLKSFGATNGMIVVDNFDKIRQFADEIASAGYGFSALSPCDDDEIYDRDAFISMLTDWDWSGPVEQRPTWLD